MFFFHKEKRAKKMFERLYVARKHMTPSQIIGELYKIHDYHRIPLYAWHEGGNKDLWLYTIMRDLSFMPTINSEHVQPLVQMLSWPEMAVHQNARMWILRVVDSFPSTAVLAQLHRHLERVHAEIDSIRPHLGTYRGVDLREEARWVEAIINYIS